MFEELEQQSKEKRKAILHPKIPFVLIHNKDYMCLKHPENARMNRGAMKQHIRGKEHRLDWDTGKSLNRTSDYVNQIQDNEMINQKTAAWIDAEMKSFMKKEYKLKAIFASEETPTGFLLAKHGLEGEFQKDVIQWLQLRMLEKENNKSTI